MVTGVTIAGVHAGAIAGVMVLLLVAVEVVELVGP